jgi:drug/metabolite transporter (DMT)-like permease
MIFLKERLDKRRAAGILAIAVGAMALIAAR